MAEDTPSRHTHLYPSSLITHSSPLHFSLSLLPPSLPPSLSPFSLTVKTVWPVPALRPLHCHWNPHQLREREQHHMHHSGLPQSPWAAFAVHRGLVASPAHTHVHITQSSHLTKLISHRPPISQSSHFTFVEFTEPHNSLTSHVHVHVPHKSHTSHITHHTELTSHISPRE